MKKILSIALFSAALSAFGQTYCIPAFSNGCGGGDEIDSFTIPGISFNHSDTGCSNGAYGDYTSQTINLNAGVVYPFNITHQYGTQKVRIWIDLNNDGTFDETAELVGAASSTFTTINSTDGAIAVPAGASPGMHRMRVATRYNVEPVPCNTAGYGEVHDYSVNIGAAPGCLAPTNLSVSAIGANSATLSWTAPSSAVGVGYEYYISTSSAAPVSTTPASGSVSNPAAGTSLPNLLPTTNYYVWVRSVCSTADKSGWSTSAAFRTVCGTVTPNFTFDFSSGINECWKQADGGTPATGPTGTTSEWYESGFLNNGYTGAMKMNILTYSFNPATFNSWLITPTFNLSAGGYRVSFDYGLTEAYDTSAGTLGSDDLVQFAISQDGGTTWTVVKTWDANNSPSNTANQYVLNLTGYNSADTKFAFYATNGAVADASETDFFIDNFVVEQNVLATSEATAAANTIKAYPNPFSEVLNISNTEGVKQIVITDAAGRLIKTVGNPATPLYLGELKQGIYMIILEMKDGTQKTIKTVKK
ncbi:T9SS type A sorting domain-containing protein [Chryseobacterium sp. SN22]|uniref:GEVED domain-containing protein n=1 Tax=Chryseobacterium sp. SN22 TaxID=2606431 RepID=UPI0011EF42A2|nr:GEVED domain-containing protein [Chryseobacterium sp. SN22]KAA0126105.1 T9SS type A sorting domain-containing protein [Chryseobacterium sp. SN22]